MRRIEAIDYLRSRTFDTVCRICAYILLGNTVCLMLVIFLKAVLKKKQFRLKKYKWCLKKEEEKTSQRPNCPPFTFFQRFLKTIILPLFFFSGNIAVTVLQCIYATDYKKTDDMRAPQKRIQKM